MAVLFRPGNLPDGIGCDSVWPGFAEHSYTQVRGAEPKLAGPSVYMTGLTPFDRTIDFECIKRLRCGIPLRNDSRKRLTLVPEVKR